jgi:hypothetical protein
MSPAPGWVLIASAIATGIIAMLEQQAFAPYAWVPVALAVLAAIVKVLASLAAPPASRSLDARAPSAVVRFLFGG